MKKNILLCLLVFLFFNQLFAITYSTNPDECVDGVCFVPKNDEEGNQVYAIVSPVGYHDVSLISQVKRLDSLNGKNIALVGGSFMASTTHNELKKCIEEEFPDSKIFLFNDIGQAGPFSVFGATEKTKTFQEKLKALKIDAVITGNCGCGLCTTKETGNSIAAEYIGIPSVTVGAPTFIAQIHSTGVNRGVPVLRSAEYPGAFASHSEEELRKIQEKFCGLRLKLPLHHK